MDNRSGDAGFLNNQTRCDDHAEYSTGEMGTEDVSAGPNEGQSQNSTFPRSRQRRRRRKPKRENHRFRSPEVVTPEEERNPLASDGFLINGSVNNGAASPFAQSPAFGNNRNSANGLYTGGIGVLLGNAAFDARPFSLTGQNTPKASYNRATAVATFGGPLRIPICSKNR